LQGEKGLFGVFEDSFQPTPKTVDRHLVRWWRVSELLSEFPSATQIIDRTLLNLSRLVCHPVEFIKIEHTEAQYMFFCPGDTAETLLNQMGAMKLLQDKLFSDRGIDFLIAPAGWQRIEDLQRTKIESRQAFVAMWFADEMNQFFEDGIKPAIQEAGFICKKIDMVEHNNKICDEIIAEIRKSRFIVADFTGQRSGVYFEAGYAMGMGLPVIWLVQKSDVGNLHFDTRQYNHIDYTDTDDLKIRLYNRIMATIGQGPEKKE